MHAAASTCADLPPYAQCHTLWSLPPSGIARLRARRRRGFKFAGALQGPAVLVGRPPLRTLDSALTLPYSASRLPACQNRLATSRTAVRGYLNPARPGLAFRRRRTAGFPAAGRIPPIRRRIVFVRTARALGRPGPVTRWHRPAARRRGPVRTRKERLLNFQVGLGPGFQS